MRVGDLVKYKHKEGVGIIMKITSRPAGDNIFVMWSFARSSSHHRGLGWFVNRDWIEAINEGG